MTRDRATELGMKTARSILPQLSEEQLAEIEKLLPLMWQAGHEHQIKHLTAHNKKPVRMLDHNGFLVKTFPSVVEAAAEIVCNTDVIYSAIYKGNRTKRGNYFEYEHNKKTA